METIKQTIDEVKCYVQENKKKCTIVAIIFGIAAALYIVDKYKPEKEDEEKKSKEM